MHESLLGIAPLLVPPGPASPPPGAARPRARGFPDAPLDARAGAASGRAVGAVYRAQRTRRCPACDPRASACSSAKLSRGKLTDLLKILGNRIVGLRLRRLGVLLRRRGRPSRECLLCRAPPRGARLVSTHGGRIIVRQRGTMPVVVSECAPTWERFLCLRGEPYPSRQHFVFVYSYHSSTLLARGVPAPVFATWLGTSRSMIPARQSCRRRWSMCVMIAARRLLHEGHRLVPSASVRAHAEAYEGTSVYVCMRGDNDTGATRVSVLGRQPRPHRGCDEGHSTGGELRDHLRGMPRFGSRHHSCREKRLHHCLMWCRVVL